MIRYGRNGYHGKKQMTKADKQLAALQLVQFSQRSRQELIDTLMRSYGFSEPEAIEFVDRNKPNYVRR
jgi:hypothetical protein